MAGYSGTPLAKKLGIKEDFRLQFVGAPSDFRTNLGQFPSGVKFPRSPEPKSLDLILLFVKTEKSLRLEFANLMERLKSTGMLWIAWPKKSSGVATDLSFDVVQRIGLASGLVDVKICAIDDIWSGLKFVYRIRDRSSVARGKML